MSVESIELIRLKAVDFSTREAARCPEKSSREILQAALMCAYLEGVQEALRTIRDQIEEV